MFIVRCTALYSTLVVRASLLLTLYKLYTTWHTESFHCTQPLLLSKDVTASDWSEGNIQPSDWATPRTDTGVGPNNYSLHNNIQPTQHLHFSLPHPNRNSSKDEKWSLKTVRTLWSVTRQCDIMWWGRDRGGADASIKFPQTFSEYFLDVSHRSLWW